MEVMEIWKDVAGYEGLYKVSDFGRVKSCFRAVKGYPGTIRVHEERILSQTKGVITKRYPNPQYSVELWKFGKRQRIAVGRVVAMAFIPNPGNYPQVNHIDGDRSNNCTGNLEWCTASENNYHAYATGLTSSGMSKAVIGVSVRSGLIVEYESIADAARRVKGNPDAIRGAVKGRLKTSAGFTWTFRD